MASVMRPIPVRPCPAVLSWPQIRQMIAAHHASYHRAPHPTSPRRRHDRGRDADQLGQRRRVTSRHRHADHPRHELLLALSGDPAAYERTLADLLLAGQHLRDVWITARPATSVPGESYIMHPRLRGLMLGGAQWRTRSSHS
jgi:hypothetical protein